ncbi:molybdopterin cofactor-binding domain-containing protein [Kutzneria sp. NPDC051319]|uniref:xanthine dehydrogenase family protein molybdopterin-binding subunit n=1 Tax=Kutzneria sp. NPDC051319 TaxID=3155047 RepID=UPI00342B131A
MIPRNLAANPRLSHWVSVRPDGTVDVRCGKVELGQGILTALAQIAADELDVAYNRIHMVPATTDSSPDEGLTAGSRSIEDSGAALRQVGAEVRAVFLAAAAKVLDSSELSVVDGLINDTVSYWDLLDDVDLDVEATGAIEPKPVAERKVMGTSPGRLDIPDKVYGRARFIHDLSLPGMLHGRVVRPPSRGATLMSLDTSKSAELDGVVEIVRDGDFLGVIADREETAVRAAELLRCEWAERDSLPDVDAMPEFLMSRRTEDVTIVDESTSDDAVTTVAATYSRPYLSHASMAPSCGVARWDGDKLELWTHSQGLHPLRLDICRSLGVAIDQVTLHHVEGAGAYGHNGADDAAFDAVLLARAVNGRPVQVVWSRADELGWAPFGAAMAVHIEADLDAAGEVVAWRHDVYSNGHVSRPGFFDAPALLGTQLRTGTPPPVSMDPPFANGGGSERNSVPLYTFPGQRITKHRLLEMPLRTSSLRALGAYANVFAIESFVDELALRAGVDPVQYRLQHLSDERARAVITAAADAAGWSRRGEGWGFAFARYSHHGAYCAVVAEVEAETSVRVKRLTLAVDAGAVVSPDGLRNQVEGGAIQSTSWTVKEQVRFDRSRVTSTDWESYPILRFSEVPEVEVVIVDRPDRPSLGAGETAQGPTAAAIANALHSALGVRVRDLPLTPAAIIAAL